MRECVEVLDGVMEYFCRLSDYAVGYLVGGHGGLT